MPDLGGMIVLSVGESRRREGIMNKSKRTRAAFAYLAPEKVQQVQELRRSGAAGKHNPTPNRQRTRATQKASALRDW